MTNARDARIAPTAYYTSYVWHWLGLPYADLFATARGRRLFWSLRLAGEGMLALSPGLPSMAQYLALRHRTIDWALRRLEPDRVIELGAGLSRRGVTFAADHGVRYLEVDLPHMIAEKRRLLESRASSRLLEQLAGQLTHHAIDVTAPDAADQLAALLAGARRPVVVGEGLFGYFPPAERLQIFRAIAQALATSGGGTLLAELRSSEGGLPIATAARALRGAIWLVTRGRGAAADFPSPAGVRHALLTAGFSTADPIPPEQAVPDLAHLRVPTRVWQASPP
ncbi:MAG: class I SAM-dependent methyltransferase [Polyangiaceae bacterium]|nr:class I SAM-dependent methyltransferase [Polyangiaceae bacterium]